MMDEMKLYESIDLSKPWDDPANLQVSKKAPVSYRCPSFSGQPDHTTYLAVVTDASCLRPGKSCSLSEITDDPMKTIVIIEVPSDRSINWMSPNDADEDVLIDIQSKSKLVHEGVFNAALASGTVSSVPINASAKSRRAWITVSGGDKADSDL